MLVLRPIAAAQARYYLEGPGPGQWLGGGATELGLRGAVDELALHHVLAGRRPEGDALLERLAKNRRSGFDLILAAPKSVSLLAALADGEQETRFLRAHERAVGSAFAYLERNAAWTRRGADGDRMATSGFLAASYTHRQSGAGDPHLHSHVVVANAVRAIDGRWSALDSRAMYRHARAGGAVFQAALRHELADHGLRFGWTVGRHGHGDIVGVPRAAIEAASLRHRQVRAEVVPELAGTRAKATAAGRTRGTRAEATAAGGTRGTGATPAEATAAGGTRGTGATPAEEPWLGRVEATGWGRGPAGQLLETAARRAADTRHRSREHTAGAPALTGVGRSDRQSIDRLLTEQHSRFHRADVVRAAAVLAIEGARAPDLEAAAAAFLQTAVTTGLDTWTTNGLLRMQERIVDLALPAARQYGSSGVVAGLPPPRDLGPAGQRAFQQLTGGGAAVERLTGTFLEQAAVLDAARTAWEASGHRVAMVGSSQRGQSRWRAVAGLEGPPPVPGHAPAPAPGHAPAPAPASIVLVDRADRLSTADLHSFMSDAVGRRAKVVLIEGGSGPPRRQAESPAMEILRARLPAVEAGPTVHRRGIGRPADLADPTGPAGIARPANPARHAGIAPIDARGPRTPGVARVGREAAVTLALSGSAATDQLLADWSRLRAGGQPARMVALGPEEAEHLNSRARSALAASGALGGPAIDIGGRSFQVGDEVVALRRDPRLGSVAGGALGRIGAVDAGRDQATIIWAGREEAVMVDATKKAIPLAHSYATTPSYLRHGHEGPLLSLGHVQALAPQLRPTQIYEVVPSPSGVRALEGPSERAMAALQAELGESARGWRAVQPRPEDLSRPVSELHAERQRLAEHLLATLPSDPRPELRRLGEERAWLASVPDRPGETVRATALAAVAVRAGVLSAASGHRQKWLEAHRDHVQRWGDLSLALSWREAALGRGAELRPTVAVEAQIGPPPADGSRGAWREAAGAIEVYREQWALPDRPLDLSPQIAPERDLSRRAGELRVLAAARSLDRRPGRETMLTPGGP